MRFRAPLAAALAVCLTLVSCASSAPPVSGQQRPLPADYVQRCQPPAPVPVSGEADLLAAVLKALYDQYGICAGRMADLLNWLDGGQQ